MFRPEISEFWNPFLNNHPLPLDSSVAVRQLPVVDDTTTLQDFYTSPPLPEAIAATPINYQSDDQVNAARALDGDGLCGMDGFLDCQMLFPPPVTNFDSKTTRIGVLFYGGAGVDPRSYSIIAQALSQRHGLAVAIPIFYQDFAVGRPCLTGRVKLAAKAFPTVQEWVLAGHSLGGIAAQQDFWYLWQSQLEQQLEDDNDISAYHVGGLALFGSYLRRDFACGSTIDFSNTTLPMAEVQASLDGIVNQERMLRGRPYLPQNTTMRVTILRGNHAQFGSYNYSQRPIVGNPDGIPTIPNQVQREWVVAAILHVASQLGVELPKASSAQEQQQPKVETTMEASKPDDTEAIGTVGAAVGMLLFA